MSIGIKLHGVNMGVPLAALAIQPPPDPTRQIGQAIALKGMLQNQQFQQQAQPLRLQQEQQATQSSAIDLQMKQLALKNSQVAQGAMSDPNFEQDFKQWRESKGAAITPGQANAPAATSPTGEAIQLHPFAQYLAERKGLSMFGPGGALEISQSLTGNAQKMAELLKTQGDAAKNALDNHTKQLDNFDNLVAPILEEKDPGKQQAGVTQVQSELQAHPELYPPEATQHMDKLGSPQGLQMAANGFKLRKMLTEDATQQAESSQKQLAAGAPTPKQIQDATNTVSTYGAIPPNMRAAFSNEIKNSPNYETLQANIKRADAANESFQRSADARAQASAMKDVATQNLVAGKLASEDEKLGSALDQTAGIRSLLDMSKGGNQAATSAALTRFAEHEIVEGGVKRMNQLEYENLATRLGSYGRKFQSWVDGGFKGEMPKATNSEIHTILDAEDAATTKGHERNVGYITNRYIGKNQSPNTPPPVSNTAPPQEHPFFSQFGGTARPQIRGHG